MVVGSERECGLCLLVLSVLWFVSVGLWLVIVVGFGAVGYCAWICACCA